MAVRECSNPDCGIQYSDQLSKCPGCDSLALLTEEPIEERVHHTGTTGRIVFGCFFILVGAFFLAWAVLGAFVGASIASLFLGAVGFVALILGFSLRIAGGGDG